MVPFVSSLLLVLAATTAAEGIFKGHVRHRRQYDNRTSIDSTSSSTTEPFEYVPLPSGSVSRSPVPATASSDGNDDTTAQTHDAASSLVTPNASEVFLCEPSSASPTTSEAAPETPVYDSVTPGLANSSNDGPIAYEPATTLIKSNRTVPHHILPTGSGYLSPSPDTGLGITAPSTRRTGYLPSGHISLQQPPHAHFPPGSAPSSNPPRPYPTNATCGGATLNIADASLDYWYTHTYTQVVSTFVIQYDRNKSSTGWTLLPASQTLNITSAVEAPSCTSITAFNTIENSTMLEYSCWETPTPVAAATTTVEQTAYIPVNQTTSKGTIPDVVVDPTPAALTISDASNTVTTVAEGTPVVHFSQFEIISKRPFGNYNGTFHCVTTTQVHELSEPLSFEYEEGGKVNALLVKGKIHAAMLQAVEEDTGVSLSSVSLGTFKAEPTVVVVVQKVLAAAVSTPLGAPKAAGTLATPTPTLPSGLSLVGTTPTDTGIIWAPFTAHVESSESTLMVPTKSESPGPDRVSVQAPTSKPTRTLAHFTAHIESSDLNLATPVDFPATDKVLTATFSGILVTATSNDNPRPSSGAGGNGIENIISAIASAVKPTNALQVLSNAEHTFANPTIGAAASGIGGLVNSNNGGSGSSSGSGSGGQTGSQAGQNPVFNVGIGLVTASNIGGGAFVVAGQTVSAGGAPITVNGQRFSIAPGATAAIVGDITSPFPRPTNPGAAANIPLITVGRQVFTANAATQFNIGRSTLTPGGQIVIQGTTISLAPGATQVAVNGVVRQLSPPAVTPAPLLTIERTVYQPNSGSTYDIGGQLLAPGGVIVVAGTTISLPADGLNVILNGLVQPWGAGGANSQNLATITAPPVITVDGRVLSPNGGTSYFISGQTLTPGGAITFRGSNGLETISFNPAADELISIANGQTATSYLGVIGAASGGAPVLTIHGKTYTAVDYIPGSGATYVIDGQTLTPGGAIAISGLNSEETISLLRGGTAIVAASADGRTTSQISGAYGVKPTQAPILTIGGETFTAFNNGATYVIDGETLAPGHVDTVTVNGHTYLLSLSPQATLLEIIEIGANGQPITTIYETLFPATAKSSTVTATAFMNGAAATKGASPSNTGTTPTNARGAGSSSGTTPASRLQFSGSLIAIGSLSLAIWL